MSQQVQKCSTAFSQSSFLILHLLCCKEKPEVLLHFSLSLSLSYRNWRRMFLNKLVADSTDRLINPNQPASRPRLYAVLVARAGLALKFPNYGLREAYLVNSRGFRFVFDLAACRRQQLGMASRDQYLKQSLGTLAKSLRQVSRDPSRHR